jgi:hypothetical protein
MEKVIIKRKSAKTIKKWDFFYVKREKDDWGQWVKIKEGEKELKRVY